ncbi:MAG TPA: hypothetical protein VGL04_07300 [Sporichthyaceae bacterium]|jgi:hypothetical protein
MLSAFPLPPADIARHSTNTTGQAALTVLLALDVAIVYALAGWFWRRYRTPVPLLVAAGASFSAVIEPLPDAVANLWYYAPGQHSVWTSYQNSLPVWTFLSYTVYYGGIGMLFWWLIERGASRQRLALICVPVAIFLGAGELFFMHVLHMYTYYGPAAFKVADYPCWIPLLNLSIVVSIGAAAARMRRSVSVRDQLFPAFLLPSVAVVLGLLVEPMAVWTVLHGNRPRTSLLWAATALTIVLALGVTHTALRMLPAEGFSPLQPGRAGRTAQPLAGVGGGNGDQPAGALAH